MYKKEDHFTDIKISGENRKNYYGNFYFILNGETYSSLRSLLNNLRNFDMSSEEYYRKYYMLKNEDRCIHNPEFKTPFEGLVKGYRKYCNKCPECKKIVKEKQSISAKKPEVMEAKLSKMKIWRENNPDILKISAKKRADNQKEILGEDYFSKKAKFQWQKKSPEERKKIGQKAVETKTKNGTLNIPPNFKGRRVLIEDKEYFVQGYEDSVLYFLHELGYDFKIGKDVPRIKSDINKSGFSRPDIFIESLNLIIEVKSEYTLKIGWDNLKNVFFNAIESHHHNYSIFAVNADNKNRVLSQEDKIQIKAFLDMVISSQAQKYFEKVQRLSATSEYRPIVIGSGSARVPKNEYMDLHTLRNVI